MARVKDLMMWSNSHSKTAIFTYFNKTNYIYCTPHTSFGSNFVFELVSLTNYLCNIFKVTSNKISIQIQHNLHKVVSIKVTRNHLLTVL